MPAAWLVSTQLSCASALHTRALSVQHPSWNVLQQQHPQFTTPVPHTMLFAYDLFHLGSFLAEASVRCALLVACWAVAAESPPSMLCMLCMLCTGDQHKHVLQGHIARCSNTLVCVRLEYRTCLHAAATAASMIACRKEISGCCSPLAVGLRVALGTPAHRLWQQLRGCEGPVGLISLWAVAAAGLDLVL